MLKLQPKLSSVRIHMNTLKNNIVNFENWGFLPYQTAWQQQEALVAQIAELKIANRTAAHPQITPNYLIFCSHPHVYTLGRSGQQDNLLLNETELKQRGIDFYRTNRGGDITYHGPGQIVGYPILDLENFFTDIHLYMRNLEEVIIRMLADWGIIAGRLPGATGVWLQPEDNKQARKICALGVRCTRWITLHGWALNVNADLSYFNNIIPCGITDKGVTTMSRELNLPFIDIETVQKQLLHHFEQVFECQITHQLPTTTNQ